MNIALESLLEPGLLVCAWELPDNINPAIPRRSAE